MQDVLPSRFAILRTHTTRGPYCQVLGSRKLRNTNTYDIYSVEIVRRDICDAHYVPIDYKQIYRIQARIANGNIRSFYLWQLPFHLDLDEQLIPLFDFHFNAWLPSPSMNVIQMSNANEVVTVYSEMRRFWNSYQSSNAMNEGSSSSLAPIPFRPPTPPRSRNSSQASTHSGEAHSVMTVYPHSGGPAGSGDTAFQPLQQRSSSPPPSRPLPIPKFLGDLLIQEAQKGEECCTITAIPFKDIERLTATSCFHVFDTTAINRWCRDHNSCPVCRTPITNMISKN